MTRYGRWITGAAVIAAGVVLWGGSTGCKTDEVTGPSRTEAAPEMSAATAEGKAGDRTEVDLIQEMLTHRAMYARLLRVLATYYSEHGYENKANWARSELSDVQQIRPYLYIVEDNSGAKKSDASLLTSLESPSGIELQNITVADRTEVDIVEELLFHRETYARLLRVLATTYYSEHGMENKANWARNELRDFQHVKTYRYIKDSESPQASVHPRESIAEADKLYADAHKLMNKAGHHVPIFYNDATMRQALSKMKEIVERFPTSDKVAEAAYYIAEIHKEYNSENDNEIAVEWYTRAVEWDPNLNHPAWSHCAHVLDFRMHEREKALEWYQKVLEKEKGKTDITFARNVAFAEKRIEELTPEENRHAPGEPIPTAPPAGEPGHAAEASPPPARVP